MQASLIQQIAYLVWAGKLADIDELLNSHIENAGKHLPEIIKGRRQFLFENGSLARLPPLQEDVLINMRRNGQGYVHVLGTQYNSPVARNRK